MAGFSLTFETLQVRAHFRCDLVSKFPILFQRFADDLFQFRWQVRIQPQGSKRRTVQDGVKHGRGSVAAERKHPRRHLVKYSAERKQVGPGVEISPLSLLRRHIGNGSYCRTWTGQQLSAFRNRRAGEARARLAICDHGQLGQAEIENLRVPAFGRKYICGLDIAMDDAFAVGCIQSVRDVHCQGQEPFIVDRRAADEMLHGASFQIFHRNESLTVLIPNVINGANVGMVESGCSPRFSLKAGQSLRIAAEFRRQELKSDVALQAHIHRLVDNTHPAAAEFFDDLVVRDVLANHFSTPPTRRPIGQQFYEGHRQKSM